MSAVFCPACRAFLHPENALAVASDGATAAVEEGDLGVCMRCAAVYMYGPPVRLVPDDEIQTFDDQTQLAVAAWQSTAIEAALRTKPRH